MIPDLPTARRVLTPFASVLLVAALTSLASSLPGQQDIFTKYRRLETPTHIWAVAPGLADPSEPLQERVSSALLELRTWLGSDSGRRPLLVLVAGQTGLNAALAELGAEAVPAWVPAVALSQKGIAIIDLQYLIRQPGKGSATVVHELAHLVLSEAGGVLPRWVHEGIAQSVARQYPDPSTRHALILLARNRSLLSITDLEKHLPADHYSASLLYAEALLFIDWTRRRWGEDLHARILDHCQKGVPWAEAFERVSGFTIDEATEQWQQELAESDVVFGLLLDLLLSWRGLALLVVIAAVVQRFRRRARLRQMKQEEEEQRWNSPGSPTSDGPNQRGGSESTD
ncbi:MAG: peptidase MA family metallohydrolase [Planctomycetota bacterium]|nr:peptidase MA family metallohydrolase [Planctomycetota bacterium]